MKQILVCKSCKRTLSAPVLVYDELDGRRKSNKGYLRVPPPKGSSSETIIPKREAGMPVISSGKALSSKIPCTTLRNHELGKLPQWVLNLDDIKPEIDRNQNWKIDCCGANLSDRPNRQCLCGSPIGYELSECFTEHAFIVTNKYTIWRPVK